MSKNTGTSELINYFDLGVSGAVGIGGNLTLSTIANATTDTDKFLVSDTGIIKYRTGAELLSDIGAQTAGNYVTLDTAQSISGLKTFNSGSLILAANGTASPTIIRNTSGTTGNTGGFNTIGFNSNNNIFVDTTNSGGFIFDFNNTVSNRVYTLQNASGTLAFTSDLGNYVTLSTTQTIVGQKTFTSPLTIGTTGNSIIYEQSGNLIFQTGASADLTIPSSGAATFGFGLNVTGALDVTGAATFSSSVTLTTSFQPIINLNTTSTNQASAIVTTQSGTSRWAFGTNLGSGDDSWNVYNYVAASRYLTIASTGAATFSSSVTSQVNNISADGAGVVLQGYVDNNLRIAVRGSGYNSGARGGLLASTGDFSGTIYAATLSQFGTAVSGQNVQLNINGVSGKAKRIEFQNSGVQQWLIGAGAASETTAFEIFNSNGQMSLSIDKASSNAAFYSKVTARNGTSGVAFETTNAVNADFTIETTSGGLTKIGTGGNILGINVGGGNVGIGTASPVAALNVSNVPTSFFGIIETTGASAGAVKHFRVHKPFYVEYGIGILADNSFHISTASTFPTTNGFTITSAGNVGINKTIPDGNSKLDVNGQAFVAHLAIYNDNGTPSLGTSPMLYSPASATLAISTGATERMRITSGGFLKAKGSETTYLDITSAGNYHELRTGTGNQWTTIMSNTSASPYILNLRHSNSTPNNSDNWFLYCEDLSNVRFRVASNGNVTNQNGSYGSISDIKLKENIKDSSPKLDDLMRVKVRNYNLIGENTKQIGVIAQELEEIFPAMIDESPDKDKDGNDLGTTTKSVKYSVFVPMLIKAIQEQQVQIQELKNKLS
jgi:hypothetical protein